jgi:SnoaL-like domain
MNDSSRLGEFATRYTAAWCSHSASSVAAFYSELGTLTINDGPPAVGRKAVEGAAQSFMTAYPDLVVKFDRLEPKGDRVLYHWTFTGTDAGPGGTGNQVRISGYEDWVGWTDRRLKGALRRAGLGSTSESALTLPSSGGIRRGLSSERRLGRVRRIVRSDRLSWAQNFAPEQRNNHQ